MTRYFACVVAIWATNYLTLSCHAAEPQSVQQILHLKSAPVGTLKMFYEPILEPQIEAARGVLLNYQAGEAARTRQVDSLWKRQDEILREIDGIVGLSPADALKSDQGGLARSILGGQRLLNLENATLYLLTSDTIKENLKNGVTLPGFSYNTTTNQAVYNFNFSFNPNSEPKPIEIMCPISTVPATGGELRELLRNIQSMQDLGVFFHELTEGAIVLRLKPTDAHFRWFSDGFANALTERLLRKYVGEDEARKFAAQYDTAPYADLEKQLNLRYWLGAAYGIHTSLESEERLENARYAYATLVAKQFIERFGVEKIAPVLAKASLSEGGKSAGLFSAIWQVTGQDMEAHLARYQEFKTDAEAKVRYNTAFFTEITPKNAGEELCHTLRYNEVTGGSEIDCYRDAANELRLMGDEAAGAAVLAKELEQLKSRGRNDFCCTLSKFFVVFALKCKDPLQEKEAVLEAAEIASNDEPGFGPALKIKKLAGQ